MCVCSVPTGCRHFSSRLWGTSPSRCHLPARHLLPVTIHDTVCLAPSYWSYLMQFPWMSTCADSGPLLRPLFPAISRRLCGHHHAAPGGGLPAVQARTRGGLALVPKGCLSAPLPLAFFLGIGIDGCCCWEGGGSRRIHAPIPPRSACRPWVARPLWWPHQRLTPGRCCLARRFGRSTSLTTRCSPLRWRPRALRSR